MEYFTVSGSGKEPLLIKDWSYMVTSDFYGFGAELNCNYRVKFDGLYYAGAVPLGLQVN